MTKYDNFDTAKDIPDLSGKVIVITGGTPSSPFLHSPMSPCFHEFMSPQVHNTNTSQEPAA